MRVHRLPAMLASSFTIPVWATIIPNYLAFALELRSSIHERAAIILWVIAISVPPRSFDDYGPFSELAHGITAKARRTARPISTGTA